MATSTAPLKVVAIVASAGGLRAISKVLTDLPASFPATLLVVQHFSPKHRSLMVDILSRRTALRVQQAYPEAPLLPGTVYIAPPDQHLVVNDHHSLSLTPTEPVHFVRPAADNLLASVARHYRT